MKKRTWSFAKDSVGNFFFMSLWEPIYKVEQLPHVLFVSSSFSEVEQFANRYMGVKKTMIEEKQADVKKQARAIKKKMKAAR